MSSGTDNSRVRLAELVAALSLGIDLGFGQPMEHVLRQCLIALRLAERVGLDEEARAAVYYTALLVNVGCHTDAHEQAKWFGDDIAMKSGKYDHEFKSLGAAASGLRRIGAGKPPLHRFRIGLEFVVSGHRDFDGMIAEHAARARALGEQLGLPDDVVDALVASYETWDGRGWPGELKGDRIPIASRIAQLAEFVEVANRVGGIDAATAMARKRAGKQFDPALAALLCANAEEILDGLDSIVTWDAVIGAEPALAVSLTGEGFDSALQAIASFVDLKSPYTLGHSLAVADLASAGGRAARTARRQRCGRCAGPGSCTTSGVWACRTRSGTSRARSGAGEWERVRTSPYLTERMLHGSEALAPLGAIAVQHCERLDGSGYPRGLSGNAISPRRADPRRGRRVPGDARAAALPAAAIRRRGGGGAPRRDQGGSPRR